MLKWLFGKRKQSEPLLVAPEKILFSLATICDALPATIEPAEPPQEGSVVLHEDDWLQVEFICGEDRAYLETLLEEVRSFRTENWTDNGFKAIYMRKPHPTPLSGKHVLLRKLLHLAPAKNQVQPLYINFIGLQQIENGFALKLDDEGLLYGIALEGVVHALGLRYDWRRPVAGRFVSFCKAHGLALVDWNSVEILVETG